MTEFFESLKSIAIGTLSLAAILQAAVIFLLCMVLIRLLMRVTERILNKSSMGQTAHSFLRSAVKIGLWVLAVIIVAGILGVPTASLVAVLSVAGLALSLSLQGLLTNLFSGITLLASHPFKAGDLVDLKGDYGIIKDVGLLYTTILTYDNQTILIPNSDVASSRIINYSHEPIRRVDLDFGVSYNADPDSVENALKALAAECEYVLDEPKTEVKLMSYDESTVKYQLRAWVKTEDYWDGYFSLNKNVSRVFARNGIEFSYNHMIVHVDGK